VAGGVEMRCDDTFLIVLFLAAFAATGFAFGVQFAERQAIEHGCAHYDSQTGEWEWNSE